MRLLVLMLVGCADLGERSVGALEEECAGCHPVQAEEHLLSRHAMAGTSAVFEALASRQDDRMFCDRCHRPRGRDGLGCADCHAAVGNFGVENGLVALDLLGPVRGPTGVVDPRAAHATSKSEYLSSADLCGTCHEVNGLGAFRESPYTHWSMSPAAARGETCQSCHLEERSEQPIADLPGLSPRRGRSHRPIGPDDGELASSLYERVRVAIVDGPFVEIDNRANGHFFPDGASFLRDVDVIVRSGGREVARISLAADLPNGPIPTTEGRPVVRGVSAGEVRREPVPPGNDLEACIEVRRYRTDLLEALDLEETSASWMTCASDPG